MPKKPHPAKEKFIFRFSLLSKASLAILIIHTRFFVVFSFFKNYHPQRSRIKCGQSYGHVLSRPRSHAYWLELFWWDSWEVCAPDVISRVTSHWSREVACRWRHPWKRAHWSIHSQPPLGLGINLFCVGLNNWRLPFLLFTPVDHTRNVTRRGWEATQGTCVTRKDNAGLNVFFPWGKTVSQWLNICLPINYF